MLSQNINTEQNSITFKILKADLLKKKIITLLLFFFISIASFLVTTGSNMVVELMNSLNYLFSRSNVPHFVQMNNGVVDLKQIEKWAAENSLVQEKQIVEMIRIDKARLFLGKNDKSEINSIMNNDFVTQNHSFDFLFNLNGQVIHPAPGEVAVPVFYMQKYHLKIGDKLRIITREGKKEFRIVDFIRDALMNPSIIHSKRFLISKEDFKALKNDENQRVSLIEFNIKDLRKFNQFYNEYLSSPLPKNGPTIHYQLYKIINSITDGFTIGLITLVSILLTIVAILALRFTILTSMEQEYKQIGIMKAIGINQNYIQRLYLLKYFFITALACALGYLVAGFFKKFFISNIMLYLGIAPKSIWLEFVSVISVSLIFLAVILSCILVLRKFVKISAVEALRAGTIDRFKSSKRDFSLKKNKFLNLNIFLGLKDLIQSGHKYLLLFFVFFVCSFILILPINFFNTIKSPNFMTFIGIGKSDMRIDMQQENAREFKRILNYVKNDDSISKFAYVIASRFKLINDSGQLEHINIESGDFSTFPIYYLNGRAPLNSNEIALSYLNSKELVKKVGDNINLLIDGIPKKMLVTGIYQDVTNGGRTAKSIITPNVGNILWYVFNVNFKPSVLQAEKITTYANLFPKARVTNVSNYLQQTLGDLISQIKVLAILIVCVTIFITIIITSLFLKLMLARNYSQIAIMKAIGFSLNDIKIQYLSKALLILNLGIVLGVIFANTIGEKLTGIIWSFMGAPEIKFNINPFEIYFICPLVLMCVVTLTTIVSVALIKQIRIQKMIVE